tara:strand:- start:12020 stop:12232 length:213 start_codon:yes stop_codon:yes gene_type:complete
MLVTNWNLPRIINPRPMTKAIPTRACAFALNVLIEAILHTPRNYWFIRIIDMTITPAVSYKELVYKLDYI